MGRRADLSQPGPWADLFRSALVLTDHLAERVQRPVWTFGGGTVLMLRLGHRYSRDIDLFVPHPQYLGYLSPRLSEVAESLTTEYVESAESLKLQLPGGEIDIVVGEPLTDGAWETVVYQGREVLVETNTEILAKKMYHRGDRPKARDLFDLCAVADLDPAAIEQASPFFARHGETFLERLKADADLMQEQFGRIQRIAYKRPFEECLTLAELLLRP